MLKTKPILSEREISDGLRISIMSRHTLNDGITPDLRLENRFDSHLPIYAPPLKLLGDYYKRSLSWENFEKEYNSYLDSIPNLIKNLAERAINKNITLMCIEDSPEECHRRLLAERCRLICPSLDILVK